MGLLHSSDIYRLNVHNRAAMCTNYCFDSHLHLLLDAVLAVLSPSHSAHIVHTSCVVSPIGGSRQRIHDTQLVRRAVLFHAMQFCGSLEWFAFRRFHVVAFIASYYRQWCRYTTRELKIMLRLGPSPVNENSRRTNYLI